MKKTKLYALAGFNILLICLVSILFGLASAIVAGAKDFYEYTTTQACDTIEQVIAQLKKDASDVD
jgi:uncharacterized iron-regulated membrane protein